MVAAGVLDYPKIISRNSYKEELYFYLLTKFHIYIYISPDRSHGKVPMGSAERQKDSFLLLLLLTQHTDF